MDEQDTKAKARGKKKDERYKNMDEHMKQDGMEMEKKGKRQAHGSG